MAELLMWFGIIHAAFYSIAGLMLFAGLLSEWLIKRGKLKREILLAYQRILKERHAQKDRARNVLGEGG